MEHKRPTLPIQSDRVAVRLQVLKHEHRDLVQRNVMRLKVL
eukprot:SAG31_NODE_27374_length_427_cov_0.628049_1_plen_40_part_10